MLDRGEVLGRYEILCPLGSGGMAHVYAARAVGEASFEKLVALKLMLPHLSGDEKFVQMFVDEARVAGQVQSPHVVGTIDLGRVPERGLLFQVLELVLGASLRQLLDAQVEQGAPLPLDVALTILVHAARGLADAHAARSLTGAPLELVHRDVSPHNVLVGADGRARLSDFGVARAAARVAQTESGELKGKLAYASPEQLRGEPAQTRSDVFALGIVAWEALAGRRLFDAENPLAIVDLMMRAPIPSVRTQRPEVPEEIDAVIAEALVRDPDARLASAAELADRLERGAAACGGLATPARVGEVVRALAGERIEILERTIAAQLAAGPRVVRRAPEPDAASARGRGAAVAIGLAALVVVALGAVALARSGLITLQVGSVAATTPGVDQPGEPAPTPPSAAEPPPAEQLSTAAAPPVVDRPSGSAQPAPEEPSTEPPAARREPASRRIGSRRAAAPAPEPAPEQPVELLPEADEPRARSGLVGVEEFDREDETR